MKPTIKNMSDYYKTSPTTIQNWKSERPRIYQALKNEFMRRFTKSNTK